MGEEGRRGGSSEDGDVGPGHHFMHYVIMEDLIDKLKLLSYEERFLKSLGFKPLSR